MFSPLLTTEKRRGEERSGGGGGLKNLSNMLTACQGPPTTVMNFSPFVACGPAALISPGPNPV